MKVFLIFFATVLTSYASAQIPLSVVLPQKDSIEDSFWIQNWHNSFSNKYKDVIVVVGSRYNNRVFDGAFEHLILRTDDRGKSWKRQSANIPNFTLWRDAQLRKAFIVDSMVQYVVGDSAIILKTTNAGVNWTRVPINTDVGLNDLHFIDKDHGMVAGKYGVCAVTSDGGETWNVQDLTNSYFQRCIGFPPSTYYLFDWAYGKMFRTYDAGATWDSVWVFGENNSGNNIKFADDEYFIDELHGFAAGSAWDTNHVNYYRGIINYTSNGGDSWEIVYNEFNPSQFGLVGIDFLSDKNAVASGSRLGLVLSTDGGISWRYDSVTTSSSFFSLLDVVGTSQDDFLCISTSLHASDVQKGSISTNDVTLHSRSEVQLVLHTNPVIDNLTLKTSSTGELIITNLMGRIVYRQVLNSLTTVISTAEMNTGVYTISFRSIDGSLSLSHFVKLK